MFNVLAWIFGGQSLEVDRVAVTDAYAQKSSSDLVEGRADEARTMAAPGRRDRALDDGSHQLRDGIAQKILHGWLQNRHQTLYPLTVNLRTLSQQQRATLAGWMAVAMLAGHGLDETSAAEGRKWLVSVGADAAELSTFTAALVRPPSLNEIIASILGHGTGPYAYVMALMALDSTDEATLPFLNYTAVRLSLPTIVVRSATRRYRR